MNQKATMPIIVGAVVLVVILVAVLAKVFMAPPPSNPDPPKFPDFIDPATGKPKGATKGSGMQGNTGGSAPAGGSPYGGGGAPAGGSPYGGAPPR